MGFERIALNVKWEEICLFVNPGRMKILCSLTQQSRLSMTSVSKIIELRTDSETSVEDVIEDGIRQADETIRNVCNVWIKNKEILIANGSPKIYQLHLKLIFRLE